MSMNQQQNQDGGQSQQMGGMRQDQGREQQQRATAAEAPDNQGEGNRDAARRYNESQRKFAQDAERVDEAAEMAAPQSREDADEMEAAERQGRAHAKGEDPQLRAGERRQQEQDRERLSRDDKPSASEGAKSSDF